MTFFAPEVRALRFITRWLFLLKTPIVLAVIVAVVFLLLPMPVRDGTVTWLRQTGEIISGFAPAAIVVTAVVAGVVAYWTIRQKNDADRRAEWWRRMQWAIDASLAGPEAGGNEQRAAVASDVLEELFDSGLRTPEDADLADTVSAAVESAALIAEAEAAPTGPDSDDSDDRSDTIGPATS
ncbi:hypothetical protein BGP79_14155 [Tersicoccus sp. Bi-70]|nr:hypothetical protein BGP79_14155 [Tersicoccus sp. Bi-70]